MAMLSVEDAKKISITISEPIEIKYDNFRDFFHKLEDMSIEYSMNPSSGKKPLDIVVFKKLVENNISDPEVKYELLRVINNYFDKIITESKNITKDVKNPIKDRHVEHEKPKDDPVTEPEPLEEPESESNPEPEHPVSEPEPESKPAKKTKDRIDTEQPKDGTKPKTRTNPESLRKFLKPLTPETLERYKGKSFESLNRDLMLEHVLELYEIAKKDKSFVLPDMTQQLLLSMFSNDETNRFTVLATIQKELKVALLANPKTKKDVIALNKDYEQSLIAGSTLALEESRDEAEEVTSAPTPPEPPRTVINIYERFEDIIREDEEIQNQQIDERLTDPSATKEDIEDARTSLRESLTKNMDFIDFKRGLEISIEYNKLKEELDELQGRIESESSPNEKDKLQHEFAIKFKKFYDFANQKNPGGERYREIATTFTGKLRALNLADEIVGKRSKVLDIIPYDTAEGRAFYERFKQQSNNFDKLVTLRERKEEAREKLKIARARGRNADVKELKKEIKYLSGKISTTLNSIREVDQLLPEFDPDLRGKRRVIKAGIIDKEMTERESKHIGFFLRKKLLKFDIKKIEDFDRLVTGGFNYEQNKDLQYSMKRSDLVREMKAKYDRGGPDESRHFRDYDER